MRSYYLPGAHSVICDVSGFKRKSTQVMKRWDGKIVRIEDFDERHPQDMIQPRVDRQHVEDPRPRATDYFLSDNEVSASDL